MLNRLSRHHGFISSPRSGTQYPAATEVTGAPAFEAVSGSSAMKRLNGVLRYITPPATMGVPSNALLRRRPLPSETSPV
jgi:hypothetical protein